MFFKSFAKHTLAFCVAALATIATAQTSQPVTFVVGTPPGGSADGLARLIAQRLPEHIGRSVVVENKVGALGAIAVRETLNAPPGRAVFVIAPFTNVIFPALTQSSVRYDAFKDLQSVASLASFPLGVAVSSSIGVSTPTEFVAWMKRSSDKVPVGNGGMGGQTHFLSLQLGKAVGVDVNTVPYRGNAPIIAELMAGHLPVGVLVAGEVRSLASDGRARLVGMLTPTRSPLAPDVPTFVEQGIAVDAGESWFGMWASASLPKAEAQRMEAAVKKVLASKDVQEMMATRYALVADYLSAADTTTRLRAENDRWGPIIKASGFKGD